MPKRSEDLTELNRFVDARYAECQAQGGHISSGTLIHRDLHGIYTSLIVCARCEVPYTKRAVPKAAISINNRYRPKEETYDQLDPTDL